MRPDRIRHTPDTARLRLLGDAARQSVRTRNEKGPGRCANSGPGQAPNIAPSEKRGVRMVAVRRPDGDTDAPVVSPSTPRTTTAPPAAPSPRAGTQHERAVTPAGRAYPEKGGARMTCRTPATNPSTTTGGVR